MRTAVTLATWLTGPDPPPVDRATIEWIAPQSCSSSAELDALTERLLLAADGTITAHAEVTLARTDTFELTLTIGTDVRTFTANECESLARLTALLVALAADPLAVATTVAPLVPPPPPAPPPAAARAPAAVDHRPPAPTRAPPRARALHGWLGVHGIIGVAELPTLDAGIALAAAIGRGRFAAELHASWLAPREAALAGDVHATMTAINVSPRACGVLGKRTLRAVLCAGPELGALVASATDAPQPDTASELWVALVASPALHWYVHRRVALHLGADLVLALRAPRFALQDAPEQTVAAGKGGLRGWAGLAVRFGAH